MDRNFQLISYKFTKHCIYDRPPKNTLNLVQKGGHHKQTILAPHSIGFSDIK